MATYNLIQLLQVSILLIQVSPLHGFSLKILTNQNNEFVKSDDIIKINKNDTKSNRRALLHNLCSSMIVYNVLLISPNYVKAIDQSDEVLATSDNIIGTTRKSVPKKPFAPLSALLPAARVRTTINDALQIASEIIALDNSSIDDKEKNQMKKNEKISLLKQIILTREKKGFMIPLNEESNNKIFTKTTMPTSKSKLYDDRYSEELKNLPITDIPLALLTQAGDKRQFSILQKRQRRLESTSSIREALNFYTRQLQFDTESYVLNASAEEKKRMIRNDALPDIQSVIVSDLDLRDLIRNQILDAFDDVRAELEYQLRSIDDGDSRAFDAYELYQLLLRAQKECNQWFSFIDEKDALQAMNTVAME